MNIKPKTALMKKFMKSFLVHINARKKKRNVEAQRNGVSIVVILWWL